MSALAHAITRHGHGGGPAVVCATDPDLDAILSERFEILECLGQGGMGVVFRARHRALGREMALKLLRPRARNGAELLERLRREAMAAAQTQSPHVVQALDFGELSDGAAYLAMEILDGRELAEDLAVEGAIGWARTKHIALQICDALSGLHAQGIVHRDLKPENVVLLARGGDDDFVKVLDFGLAIVPGAKRITAAGLAIGTPRYMSPEQCLGAGIDPRSDIYSLGTMMYQMVAGRATFEGVGYPGILASQVGELPDDVRLYAPTICEDAAALIMRCLAKDAADRFATVDALAEAISAADESVPATSGVRLVARRRGTTLPTLPPAPPKQLRALGWLLTALGLAAVGAAITLLVS